MRSFSPTSDKENVKKAEKHWLTKGKEYIVQEDLVNDLTLRFSENKE